MPAEEIKPLPPPLPWYYTRSMVFILIFLVAGAFALPFLWFSPAFSVKEKGVWSIVGALYTAIIVVLGIWIILCLWKILIQFSF